ncbi:hypothetical protein Tco_1055335 [Tanacetum coccineum]|uniref:Uncharacterized protein n=1 Tax=Tanacetum coccineum TaxID=301880 RepID=A0ABQ5H1Q2_9ASTR
MLVGTELDFLNTCHIKYALIENPTIYVSLIEQFWQTASASTLENGDMEITATIDGKVKVVSEASIRRHLKLEDSDGISTFPTTEIFKQLALMGGHVVSFKEPGHFKLEEWDSMQAQIEADEELALRLQAQEREGYSEADKAKLLVELINERKRQFSQQKNSTKGVEHRPSHHSLIIPGSCALFLSRVRLCPFLL